MVSFEEKFGTTLLSALGFTAWIGWLNFLCCYPQLYTIDFSTWTIEETWIYVAKNQAFVWTSTVLIIYISARYFRADKVDKGSLSAQYTKKSMQLMLSNWSDPLACMACEVLFNAIQRLFGTKLNVLWSCAFFLFFFTLSFVISMSIEKAQNYGHKCGTMKIFKAMLVGSVFGNLNWFNAIALLNVFEDTTGALFPHNIETYWLVDSITFVLCTVLVVLVNIKVKNEDNNVKTALGLHIQMIYVVVLTFMGALMRDLVIATLVEFFGSPIPPLIFFLGAVGLTFFCCIFQRFLANYLKDTKDDGVEDFHDVLAELLENYNKYLFGWFLAQFWNKFFQAQFETVLVTETQKLIYAIVWTVVLTSYGMYIAKVITNKHVKEMKKKLATNANLMKKYATKEGEDEVTAYSNVFTSLMTGGAKKKAE